MYIRPYTIIVRHTSVLCTILDRKFLITIWDKDNLSLKLTNALILMATVMVSLTYLARGDVYCKLKS